MASEEVTEVAEAVSEAAGVIERGVEAVASQIAELAATYGEPAWNTVLLIVQIDAAKSLSTSAVFWCAGVAVVWLCMMPKGHFWRGLAEQEAAGVVLHDAAYGSAEYRAARRADSVGFGRAFVAAFISAAFAVVVAVSTVSLLNVWKWIALFSPELYLAKRALDAVVGL